MLKRQQLQIIFGFLIIIAVASALFIAQSKRRPTADEGIDAILRPYGGRGYLLCTGVTQLEVNGDCPVGGTIEVVLRWETEKPEGEYGGSDLTDEIYFQCVPIDDDPEDPEFRGSIEGGNIALGVGNSISNDGIGLFIDKPSREELAGCREIKYYVYTVDEYPAEESEPEIISVALPIGSPAL